MRRARKNDCHHYTRHFGEFLTRGRVATLALMRAMTMTDMRASLTPHISRRAEPKSHADIMSITAAEVVSCLPEALARPHSAPIRVGSGIGFMRDDILRLPASPTTAGDGICRRRLPTPIYVAARSRRLIACAALGTPARHTAIDYY